MNSCRQKAQADEVREFGAISRGKMQLRTLWRLAKNASHNVLSGKRLVIGRVRMRMRNLTRKDDSPYIVGLHKKKLARIYPFEIPFIYSASARCLGQSTLRSPPMSTLPYF